MIPLLQKLTRSDERLAQEKASLTGEPILRIHLKLSILTQNSFASTRCEWTPPNLVSSVAMCAQPRSIEDGILVVSVFTSSRWNMTLGRGILAEIGFGLRLIVSAGCLKSDSIW